MAEKHADQGLVVLAVNAWDEDQMTLRRFARQEDLKHRILLDGSAVYEEYGKPGVPCTMWIKPDGTVHDVELGFDDAKSVEEKTRELLTVSG